MPSLSDHLDALLLALASSTDNFTVGVSVGVGHKKLPFWVNSFISVCNATGAWIAGFGGILVGQTMPLLAPLLAACAFGVLALQEWKDRGSNNDGINKTNLRALSEISEVLRLALPMTLNNLAGGVAGGAAGLSPLVTALYALVASFVTMAVGHAIGYRLGKTTRVDPSLVSACLLGALCLLTLQELIVGAGL